MKIRNLFLLFSIIGLHAVAIGQGNTVGKGTRMIMGLGNFSSVGDNHGSDRINTLSMSISSDRFYKDNLFVGVGLSALYQSEYTSSSSAGAFAVAPEMGYAFGSQDSKAFPFIVGGCGLELSSSSDNGYSNGYSCGLNLSFGLGVLVPIQKNFGLVVESKYNNLKYLSSAPGVNTISLNFGFVGLLF